MPILTWSYWFDLQARELMPSVKIALLVAFGVLFLLGIFAAVMAAKKPGDMFWAEAGKRFSGIALWMAVLGLILLFSTHELAYFFGARFWYLVWLLVFLILMGRLIAFIIVDVPEKKIAYEEKARIEKWLPSHKK